MSSATMNRIGTRNNASGVLSRLEVPARKTFERTFLRNLLETTAWFEDHSRSAGNLNEYEWEKFQENTAFLVCHLIEEIRIRNELFNVGFDGGEVSRTAFNTLSVAEEVARYYGILGETRNVQVVVDPASASVEVRSNEVLLKNILGVMVRNALDATPPCGRVTVGVLGQSSGISFSVHHEGFEHWNLPLNLSNDIPFAEDRGGREELDSLQIIVEKSLGGTVTRTGCLDDGTTRNILLPRD